MHRLRFALLAVASVGGVGCGSADATKPTSTADPTTPTNVSVSSCAPGQMARAASTYCVPVGPTAAPDGFEADPAWGFHAIVPAGTCSETERAAIGSRDCVPIDDCNAPFPPPGAKVVVRSTGPTLADALAAAAPGDTIALDEGTYPSVVVDRDVNIVGKCASKVILQAAGTTKENGIGVDGGHKVSVRSVTFRGFEFGIWAGDAGTSAKVQNAIFEKGGAAAWVVHGASLEVQGSLVTSTSSPKSALVDGFIIARGGQATVTDTELRGVHVGLDVFGGGSHATGSGLVVTEQSPELSALVVASEGAVVEIDRSRLEAAQKFVGGAKAVDDRDAKGNAPATLHISKSELIRSLPTDSAGFDVAGGSTLELEDSTLAYRARIAISGEDTSKISLTRSVIRPVSSDDKSTGQIGAGIVINDGVRLTLDTSAIVGSAQSAILASRGCQITLTGSLVRDTWEFERKDLHKRMGAGQAISLSGDALLTMTDSTLADNAGTAIWMGGEGSSVKLERSAIVDTRGADSNALAGLYALAGTLEVTDSLFHGLPDSAVALGNVTGLVAGTVLSGSGAGFRLMGDSALVESADETQAPDTGEVITRRNVFVDIATAPAEGEIELGDCRCSTGR